MKMRRCSSQVNRCGLYIAMPHHVTNRIYVSTAFQHEGGKGVTQHTGIVLYEITKQRRAYQEKYKRSGKKRPVK